MLTFALAFHLTAHAVDRRTPVVQAVERATPAVVTIDVEVQQQNPFSFFGSSVGNSEGSGVIIDEGGVVLTNAHVVDGARSITVHTTDGRNWPASVVAMEGDLDLAVLQLEKADGLPTIAMGDSDDLLLGETVIAIGNPYGLGLTVSTGVVASIDREVEIRQGLSQRYIQTDAAINPGNSGGALVDINGKLIGINSAIHANAEGIGFAIPVNRARKIAEDMVIYGEVRAPWLGCDLVTINPRRLQGVGIDGAVRVGRVWPGGPADKAGLVPGDFIYEVNSRPLASRPDLNSQLAELKPGAKVSVRFIRGSKIHTGVVVSSSLPESVGNQSISDVLGIQLVAKGGILQVVKATEEGSWAQAKLRVGDVIVGADGRRLRTVPELQEAISRAKARHRGSLLFTVQRDRYQGQVEVGV